MKLGFIGTGNMATAIITGVRDAGFLSGKDMAAFDIHTEKLKALAESAGLTACASNAEVAASCSAVLLAVKPHMIAPVLGEMKQEFAAGNKLLISIAAGTTIAQLEALVGANCPIVRVMPNVNLMAGAGVAAVCGNTKASREHLDFVLGLFRSAGMAFELEERFFSVFTAIAGSSPAYAYLFIDSMARAAVKYGMPKELATRIAAQAVFGSAKTVLESTDAPWVLIDKVCSPGGTTVAGLLALEEEKFLTTVVKGIDAAIARDQELMAKK